MFPERSPYSLPVSSKTLSSSRAMMNALYCGSIRQHILLDDSPAVSKVTAEQAQNYKKFLESSQCQILLAAE